MNENESKGLLNFEIFWNSRISWVLTEAKLLIQTEGKDSKALTESLQRIGSLLYKTEYIPMHPLEWYVWEGVWVLRWWGFLMDGSIGNA
jgi:hypothetical protein